MSWPSKCGHGTLEDVILNDYAKAIHTKALLRTARRLHRAHIKHLLLDNTHIHPPLTEVHTEQEPVHKHRWAINHIAQLQR